MILIIISILVSRFLLNNNFNCYYNYLLSFFLCVGGDYLFYDTITIGTALNLYTGTGAVAIYVIYNSTYVLPMWTHHTDNILYFLACTIITQTTLGTPLEYIRVAVHCTQVVVRHATTGTRSGRIAMNLSKHLGLFPPFLYLLV